MHLALFTIVISATLIGRFQWQGRSGEADRWQAALKAFLLPPFCLLTTAVAVLWMGTDGQMLGHPVGNLGYLAAVVFLTMAVGQLVRSIWQGWRSLRTVRSLPQITLEGHSCRQLETDIPFAAQIGFWTPALVVSRGLIDTLPPQHLRAVLIHEQAHGLHRDTFWFFYLGWLRQVTCWLPKTTCLWQELLLLRELRADAWAARQVDAILLAEALLAVVQHHAAVEPYRIPQGLCAAFDAATSVSRLEERVTALIEQSTPLSDRSWLRTRAFYIVLVIALVPVLTIFLHR